MAPRQLVRETNPEAESDEDKQASDPFHRLLYGGEVLVSEAPVGDAQIAVTSHRVLALSPNGDVPRFQALDRPNVAGVGVRTGGETEDLLGAVRFGVYAAILLGAGALLDFEGIIGPVEAPSGVGIGGVMSLLDTITRLLAMLDEGLLVGGLLLLMVSLFYVSQYLSGRQRYLEVSSHGDEPVRIPIGKHIPTGAAIDRLETALGKASNASGR